MEAANGPYFGPPPSISARNAESSSLMRSGCSTNVMWAAPATVSSPLLDVSIHGATGILFNITSSGSLGLHELNMAAQVIAEVVDPEAEIIFGIGTDPDLGNEVKLTLIAVGFSTPEVFEQTVREERLRQFRVESLRQDEHDIVDTELPTFLRRPVVHR